MTPRLRWWLGLAQWLGFGVALMYAGRGAWALAHEQYELARVLAVLGLMALAVGGICSVGRSR